MIPKIFHFVWIGDAGREPVDIIDGWRRAHPDWEVRVYRNEDALSGRWRFSEAIEEFHRRERFPGAADLIRWEALLAEGGVALDADSICRAPLPSWLLSCSLAACWDNTAAEGDLLSNGYVQAPPNDPVIAAVIEQIAARPIRFDAWSWSKMRPKPYGEWQTTGPKPFTEVVKRLRPTHFTALPSHFFLPERRDGVRYDGGGPVYAHQLWASTRGRGDDLEALTGETGPTE